MNAPVPNTFTVGIFFQRSAYLGPSRDNAVPRHILERDKPLPRREVRLYFRHCERHEGVVIVQNEPELPPAGMPYRKNDAVAYVVRQFGL